MRRFSAFCAVASLADDEVCQFPPKYRVEARADDDKLAVLHLCSDHIHRAWHLSQLAIAKKFPGEPTVLRSIHLHCLTRVAAAEAAS